MPPKGRNWNNLHKKISTDDEFAECKAFPGLTIMEVYAGWCGPCECTIPHMMRLQWELMEEQERVMQFIVCESDAVAELKEFHNRSQPLWLLFKNGAEIGRIDCVNVKQINDLITESAPSKGSVGA